MYGCLLSILSHLATCVLVAILTNSLVFGGIMFFLPAIIFVLYFLFHIEKGLLLIKTVWPFLLLGGILILLCGISFWHNNEKDKNEKAMKLYYHSYSAERDLSECRNMLPKERYLDRSNYLNAMDEMKGMNGKKIIGNLEYGMSPRDVYDIGDSLEVFHCAEITAGKIEPTRKYHAMFNNNRSLYGVKIKYYYAWGGREDWDSEVENGLKDVIDKLKQKYGEPTIDFRNETGYHVKWNYENQVIHWYTEIDGSAYISVVYIYLPWAYSESFK